MSAQRQCDGRRHSVRQEEHSSEYSMEIDQLGRTTVCFMLAY